MRKNRRVRKELARKGEKVLIVGKESEGHVWADYYTVLLKGKR